jgi:hypothetical protein
MKHLLPLAVLLVLSPLAQAEDHYELTDFSKIPKVDAHVHLHGSAERIVKQAQADGFRLLTINVEYPDFPAIDEQRRHALALHRKHPDIVAFAATFSTDKFDSPGWAEGEIARLDDSFAQGAVGVKVWKNIGMALKDAKGSYVQIDDPRIKPLFDHLERDGRVVLGHQAEPLNCWLPLEQMTVRGDKEYFEEHPQYYMYKHPEMPSHEALLAARDHMLAQHPQLKFDAVHLASLEWDVAKVAAFLDAHLKARVDIAARISHLEHQAVGKREAVRAFFIRYQDRILYGTDIALQPKDDEAKVAAEFHDSWLADWRFLATSASLNSSEFDGAYRGLELPRAVIDKVYFGNANALFGAWKKVP